MFALAGPRPGATKEQRRYYVKWRVDGRDRTRSFKTRAQGDRFRAELVLAVREGVLFDPAMGVPSAWVARVGEPTWWTWSQAWLALKWPQWSGHSRRSVVESLALITPLMVREGAPTPPTGLADWLRQVGYRPGAPPSDAATAWFHRWSVPLDAVDAALIERVLQVVCARADRTATVPAVARRRRGTLGAVLRAAVRRGLLPSNPMDRTEWRAPIGTAAIDVATVPAPDAINAMVDHVATLAGTGARYAALFATVGMAGMRPSEAVGLHVADLELPDEGWGLAALRGALTSPGTRYTVDGAVVEAKGLKNRAVNATRDVPLPPGLVMLRRNHLDRFGAGDDRLFTNARGASVTSTNYGPVWVRARSRLWPPGHPLASTTVYDLRHAAATMMLRAGVPPAEVARRLGHSVDVLMRVYAGVFDDERDRSNALIDDALRLPIQGESQ